MEHGCGQRCGEPRKNCPHKCVAPCHPGKPCPDVPCEAEMRHYCTCGNRYVVTICKSIEDRKPLDCNASCWKKQREKRISEAFSDEKAEETKESFQFEYYPDTQLEYAEKNFK
jgi:transcriptional repressor NF-X1